MTDALRVGILALQGAYDAHSKALAALGATPVLVRRPDQLKELDGLILPGGESTTFLRHLERDGFFDALSTFVRRTPTFGTCAGVILLARTSRTRPNPRSPPSTSPSPATPTVARSTPPSSPPTPNSPAAR